MLPHGSEVRATGTPTVWTQIVAPVVGLNREHLVLFGRDEDAILPAGTVVDVERLRVRRTLDGRNEIRVDMKMAHGRLRERGLDIDAVAGGIAMMLQHARRTERTRCRRIGIGFPRFGVSRRIARKLPRLHFLARPRATRPTRSQRRPPAPPPRSSGLASRSAPPAPVAVSELEQDNPNREAAQSRQSASAGKPEKRHGNDLDRAYTIRPAMRTSLV
jgi:hypothetical protein